MIADDLQTKIYAYIAENVARLSALVTAEIAVCEARGDEDSGEAYDCVEKIIVRELQALGTVGPDALDDDDVIEAITESLLDLAI